MITRVLGLKHSRAVRLCINIVYTHFDIGISKISRHTAKTRIISAMEYPDVGIQGFRLVPAISIHD